jgi:hypothetical protein
MNVTVNVPKVWEILNHFKDFCQLRGWKTSKYEDWVMADNEYHNFLWVRKIHPSTFRKVAMNHKFAIREGVSYQVVKTAYTAWLFPEEPPKTLMKTVMDNKELLKGTAIYDLSSVYAGKPLCWKLNKTDSVVFREFEKFLQENCGIDVKPT